MLFTESHNITSGQSCKDDVIYSVWISGYLEAQVVSPTASWDLPNTCRGTFRSSTTYLHDLPIPPQPRSNLPNTSMWSQLHPLTVPCSATNVHSASFYCIWYIDYIGCISNLDSLYTCNIISVCEDYSAWCLRCPIARHKVIAPPTVEHRFERRTAKIQGSCWCITRYHWVCLKMQSISTYI